MALTKIDDRGLKTPIDLLDNEKIRLGTGNDLELYHDESSSIIYDNGTGPLNIQTNNSNINIKGGGSATHDMAIFKSTEGVELFYNNRLNLATTGGGIKVSSPDGEATIQIEGFENNAATLQFNADEGDDHPDFWRLRNSTGTDFSIENYADSAWEKSIECNESGNVELYYDNSKKFETTSTGINITDSVYVSHSRLLVGTSTNTSPIGWNNNLQVAGTNAQAGISIRRDSNDTGGPLFVFGKSRGSLNGNTVVQDGDSLGSMYFVGADGTDVNTVAAQIAVAVDGTPGSNDMPGRMVFKTTADGASSATERMRIDSSGRVGIGNPTLDAELVVKGAAHTVLQVKSNDEGTRAFIQTVQASDIRIGSATNHPVSFYQNGTERMRIDSSGRLLLGTTTEGHDQGNDLTLANSGHCGISIKSGTSSYGNIFFSDGTSNNDSRRGAIQYDHTNNKFYFATNTVTALTLDSSQNADFTGHIKPAAGKGIHFGANSDTGRSVSSNILDDYEEGTYTPTLNYQTSDDGNKVYSVQHGVYTKIGRSVTVHFHLEFTNKGTGSGNIDISLPFAVPNLLASTSLEAGGIIHYFSGLSTSWSDLKISAIDGQTRVEIYGVSSSHSTSVSIFGYSHIGNAWSLRGTITYFTT